MTKASEPGAPPQNLAISLTRVFDAPRALVFEAWSTAEHVKQWFCPEGFMVPECTVEFRAGGTFDVCMRAPDGQDHWSRGTYHEIVPLERIVFVGAVVGDDGKPLFEAHTTITFGDEDGGRTRLDVHQRYTIFDPKIAPNMIAGAEQGWGQTLDRLAALLTRMAR